ncbi:MAG: ATP-binding protein, partial [Pararobbsia sp.]
MNAIFGMMELQLQAAGDDARRRKALTVMQQAAHDLLALIDNVLDVSKWRRRNSNSSRNRSNCTAGRRAGAALSETSLLRRVSASRSYRWVERTGAKTRATRVAGARTRETTGMGTRAAGAAQSGAVAGTRTRTAGRTAISRHGSWRTPCRLRQVVANLLSNAVKFTAVGGVRLEYAIGPDTWWGDESVTKVSTVLEFPVIDSGVGIAEADRATLFEPFSQAGEAQRGHYGGTGLGLSICKRTRRADGRHDRSRQHAGRWHARVRRAGVPARSRGL